MLIAEHSMCQPGRPSPHGLSHDGSPGLADFHSAKSATCRFRSPPAPPSPCIDSIERFESLPYLGVFADVEVHVAVRLVGESLVDQAFDELDDLGHALGCPREVVDLVDAERRQVAVVVGDVFLGDLRASRCRARWPS